MLKNYIQSFAFLCSGTLMAQVPNGGFESWIKETHYQNPTGFNTGNLEVYSQSNFDKSSVNLVRKEKGSDSYASLSTVEVSKEGSKDTSFAYMINGVGLDDEFPANLRGYTAFETGAKKLKIKYRYASVGMDSAQALFFLFKGNIILGSGNVFILPKTIGDSFEEITFDLPAQASIADTFVIGFTSSKINNEGATPGSVLDISSFSFHTTAGATMYINDFGNWTDVTTEDPEGWKGTFSILGLFHSEIPVVKSTDAFEGNFSTKITTRYFEDEKDSNKSDTIGLLFSREFVYGYEDSLRGGFPITKVPDSLSFYYKYNNQFNTLDSAVVVSSLSKGKVDNVVGFLFKKLEATSAWKKVTIPYLKPLDAMADTLVIAFTSSLVDNDFNYVGSNVGIGNELLIDKVELVYKGMVTATSNFNNESRLSPNPSNGIVSAAYLEKSQVKLVDLAGKVVFNNYSTSSSLDLSNVKSGVYLLEAIKENGVRKVERIILE